MLIFITSAICWSLTTAVPLPGFAYHDSLRLDPYSLLKTPILAGPVLQEPLLKGYPESVYAPSFIKEPLLAPSPLLTDTSLLAHGPLLSAPPILKTVATPVLKAIEPASSYASVTQYQVAHAPVLKTIVAGPPLLKSYIPQPLDFSHGYHRK